MPGKTFHDAPACRTADRILRNGKKSEIKIDLAGEPGSGLCVNPGMRISQRFHTRKRMREQRLCEAFALMASFDGDPVQPDVYKRQT